MTENPPEAATFRNAPPSDLEAERAVLGGLMTRPDVLDDILPWLKSASFYSPAHKTIYEAILCLSASGTPVDIVTVHQQLDKDKLSSKVGGPVYLADLADTSVHSPASIVNQAHQVRELAKKRYIASEAQKLLAIGMDPALSSEDAEAQAVKFMEVMGNTVSDVRDQSMAEVVPNYMSALVRLSEGKGSELVIPTVYPDLNRFISGFVPGEVIVLAGRPGTGKTALALNILQGLVVDNVPCGIASMEMIQSLLLNRLFASGANVDAQKFREGHFSRQDWDNIQHYAQTLSTSPLRVCDKPNLTPSELRSQLRAWKRTTGLKVAAVDYLQLLKPQDRRAPREQQVAEASRTIKTIAVELKISILLLAQLNREAEKTKKPLMSQLRESGAIEQDADIILFIVPWKGDGDVAQVEIDVAKGRNNACGSFNLMYRRKHLQFVTQRPGGEYSG